MWTMIYEAISTTKPSNKPPPMAVREDEEDCNEPKLYDDELVKIQRSKLHKIASRPTVFPITDVVYWVASHVDS